jgi:phosphatidylglycerol:prolipoprotein diacylglycerol transferase
VISITVCIALAWIYYRAPRQGLSRTIALDLGLIVMITSFIGARLFHVFYENFEYYQAEPIKIFYVWEGGFVYYGGALLSAFAGAIFLYLKSPKNLEAYFDLFAPVMSLSYILGRGACLLTGCCFGKTCDLPWAIAGRHPTQAYAMIFELGALILILGLEKVPYKERRPRILGKAGAVLYVWLIFHALGRLIMEHFRDDFRGPNLGLSISSWISITLIVLSVYLVSRKNPNV